VTARHIAGAIKPKSIYLLYLLILYLLEFKKILQNEDAYFEALMEFKIIRLVHY
jgi:hypothetical protein